MKSVAENACAESREKGRGGLLVESVDGCSAVTSAWAREPFKLLVPKPRGDSVWAYTSSFGGGLVAGDQTQLALTVGAGARAFVGSQSANKVYRNPAHRPCGHRTDATIGEGSLLVFAPDPVQAFAGAEYAQTQEFQLAPGGSLILLDWFSAGRVARGERWAFDRFRSRNTIWQTTPVQSRSGTPARQLVFVDSLLLEPQGGPGGMRHRVGRFNCFATLVLLGPAVCVLAERLLADAGNWPVDRSASRLASASPLSEGAVLRLAGGEVEEVGQQLRRHLTGVNELLGDDPWARKW